MCVLLVRVKQKKNQRLTMHIVFIDSENNNKVATKCQPATIQTKLFENKTKQNKRKNKPQNAAITNKITIPMSVIITLKEYSKALSLKATFMFDICVVLCVHS